MLVMLRKAPPRIERFSITANDLCRYAPRGWMVTRGGMQYVIAVCQREGIPLAHVQDWMTDEEPPGFWHVNGPARWVRLTIEEPVVSCL